MIKKSISLFFVICIIMSNSIFFSSCSVAKKEVSIEFLGNTIYFDDRYQKSYFSLSISELENSKQKENKYLSNSVCYSSFLITFNNIPDGYSWDDIYRIVDVEVNEKEELYYQNIIVEKGQNEFSAIVYVPMKYLKKSNKRKIEAIVVEYFDNLTGDKRKKTIETEFSFESEIVPNCVSKSTKNVPKEDADIYFDCEYKIEYSEKKEKTTIKIDSSVEYDKIIYCIEHDAGFEVVQDYMENKSDVFEFEFSRSRGSFHVKIIGFQANGIDYYFEE